MKLNLVNVDDKMARSVISQTELEVGSLVEIKGLADRTLAVKQGVELTGEIFEVVSVVEDKKDKLYAIIAPDVVESQRYESSYRWNYSEYNPVKAKEPTRAYLLSTGDRYEIDARLVAGVGLVAGDMLCVTPGDVKFTKAVGTEEGVVAMVLAQRKIDKQDVFDIVIL